MARYGSSCFHETVVPGDHGNGWNKPQTYSGSERIPDIQKIIRRSRRICHVCGEPDRSPHVTRSEQQSVTLIRPAPFRAKTPETADLDLVIPPALRCDSAEPRPGRTRSNPLIYEAIPILKEHGFLPVRVTGSGIPLSLIGLKRSGSVLVHVVRSRKPVPSAAVLRALFAGDVAFLCRMAGSVPYQIMIWVYSPSCGWRYYLVYPGGLRRDLDFPLSLNP